MKAVMVMFDTLVRKYLPNYSENNFKDLDGFAKLEDHCMVFDNFYAGSLPCIPARRELQTGRFNFLHRSWGPIEPFDDSVITRLTEAGVYTHLVTDHPHYWEDGGATYHTRYSSWEGFRGQEDDPYMSELDIQTYETKNKLNKQGKSLNQFLRNLESVTEVSNMPSVKTASAGIDFLNKNHQIDNWFLQIECFDPHEPFLLPEDIKEKEALQDTLFWPKYSQIDESENSDEILNVRARYALLVKNCDKVIHDVLATFDKYDMWEDTALIVNTDHGFLLGEHGWIGKNICPLYEDLVHLPFYMYVPGKIESGRCTSLVQTVDIAPTLAELFDVNTLKDVDGVSILKTVKKDSSSDRNALFGINGGQCGIFDGRYLYLRSSGSPNNLPRVNYTLMPMRARGFYSKEMLYKAQLIQGDRYSRNMPLLKINFDQNDKDSYSLGNTLFDMSTDPNQTNQVIDNKLEQSMMEKMVRYMLRLNAPYEEYERLDLVNTYEEIEDKD